MVTKVMKDLEHLLNEGLGELGLFSLERRELRENLNDMYKYLLGCNRAVIREC